MNRPLLLALREIRTYLRDKADLAFSLLLPIAVFALMYGAFGNQTPLHCTAHMVNEDQGGTYSSLLLERMNQLDNLDVALLTPQKADSMLERSDVLLVIYIPEDFSSKLASGEGTHLLFKQRGNGGQEGQIVASLTRGVAGEIEQEIYVQSQVKNLLNESGISREDRESTVRKFLARERECPTVGITQKTEGSSPDPVRQFLPGIITMFVLFAITLSARTIVEERKKGTLERLLTTRLSVGQLFTGKFLANACRGFLQSAILLVLAGIVFGIFTPLSFVACLTVALIFAAAASALGLLIASVVHTEDAATWVAVFFTMAMVMLAGTFFTIPENSIWEVLSRASINTYANEAFNAIIVQGASLASVGLELGVLAAVIAAGLLLSRIFFRVIPGGR